MGFSDIGCYGGEVVTPNLDQLAKDGMRFTQFYNNAKCTTTRASIISGRFPRPRGELLKQDMVTIGEVLQQAGYATSLSGKWHLGHGATTHPYHRGFDEYYGLLDGCCNFFDPAQADPAFKGGKVRVFGQNDQRITEFPDDFYTTDAFTDHAIQCIQAASEQQKPFFAHVCYTAPHYPLHAKPADIARYRGKFKMGWEAMRKQRFTRLQEMGMADESWRLSETDSHSYDWSTADQDWEDLRMATYAAMIDCMDQNIGRLMKTLEKTGQRENTVIFFLSDNGGCSEEPGGRNVKAIPGPKEFYTAVGPAWGWAQNSPFKKHKSWVHEGGICTPMIACWPDKIPAGVINRNPGHIIDFMATCIDLAGSEYPLSYKGHNIEPLEGKSLLPLLEGKHREPHEMLAWFWAGNRAIRKGDWKLVWDSRVKAWELYDLREDRCETVDLAKEQSERVASLAQAWIDWADETGNLSKEKAAK
jgi:arylsulfatase